MSLADDFDVKVGVFAARMNVGGLFLSEGIGRATEAMKDVLRHMVSSGASPAGGPCPWTRRSSGSTFS
jgi:hypothetical protein